MSVMHKIIAATLISIPLGAAAQYAVTTRTVNVRAGPDTTYPLVASLAPGTSVNVGGCIAAYTWCDVYVGNVRGFVYANYLTYPYQTGRVPIYSYGPALGLPLITFSLGNYWDDYYRGRPFYGRRSYWQARPWHEPAPRFGRDWRPPQYYGNDRRPQRHDDYRRPDYRGGDRPQARPEPRGGPPHDARPPQNRGQERRDQGYKPGPNDAQGGEAH
ncbi:MAG: SH3 domain-containing protein [Casimicrobiaceae bacterium]